jgi:hypothetical protein
MRSVMALGLLMNLYGSVNAAPVHRPRMRQPVIVSPSVRPVRASLLRRASPCLVGRTNRLSIGWKPPPLAGAAVLNSADGRRRSLKWSGPQCIGDAHCRSHKGASFRAFFLRDADHWIL